MRVDRLLLLFFLATALTGLAACASLPKFTIPSLATATARAAATATVSAGGDYQIDSGLTIGSLDTTEKALNDNAPVLESLSEEQYDPSELSQAGETYKHTIALEEEQTLIWQNGWCTTTQELLDQNLEHIRIRFTVNGETVDPHHIGVVRTRSGDLYCALFLLSVYNWPKGTTQLETEVTFTEKISDGMADYPEGTHTYQYNVTLK